MCCLQVMLTTEPILMCLTQPGGVLFTDYCPRALRVKFFPYSTASALAMFMYCSLAIDFAVFNNRISAYLLVCGKMASEVLMFLVALVFCLLMFGSAFSCLAQTSVEFAGILPSTISLCELFVGPFGMR